jgi:hypothetical protein
MLDELITFLGSGLIYALYFMNETVLLWLPIILSVTLARLWVYYIRRKFTLSRKRVLLEIKLPKDTYKSPAAMEIILDAMHLGTREGNWFAKYIKGSKRPWFSLEIASIEGKVRFFIWTEVDFRILIENQIYGQYPSAEITEATDYTRHVPYGQEGSEWKVFGTELKLTEPDPYPIKTYVDYGLDRDPKEEYKIDPMTAVIEYLGSLGKGEQAWIQILITAHKESAKTVLGLFGIDRDWKKEGATLIEEIQKEIQEKNIPKKPGVFPSFTSATKGQTDTMTAIERSISKPGFDVGIRMLYLGKGDAFKGSAIPGLMGAFKQYGSNGLNGFKPAGATTFDYPWQDYKDYRMNTKKAGLFNAYCARGFFYPPHAGMVPFILNTEELATIFHFPGSVAETPTFERIESRKGEPPSNLPF